ncbi:MAG: hypothetical protein M1825_000147 [Sarcosagium campestre]|nr:MAG: hypothetical protein M1825_000147 [Sarcosagium campestre]
MASADDVDLGQLTAEQQASLQQFVAFTNQDVVNAVPLLQRSQWNVQIAIAKFFDGESADPAVEAQAELNASDAREHARYETLLNGSSSFPARSPTSPIASSSSSSIRGLDPAPRIVPQPESQVNRRPPYILALLFTPFRILLGLISTSANLLSWLFPFLPRIFSLNRPGPNGLPRPSRNTTGRRPLNPRDTAARFIREFGEEYGDHTLPFLEYGYAHALDSAKRDLKFLLVLLLSPEHDDTASYVRHTLLAPEVVSYITNPGNNIILWGGSVQDSEAYQVATALNCTKLPAAVLITNTPQTSSTAMSVVSRIAGPTPPSAFIAKLQSATAEHGPALEGVRATRASRQAERSLREEQTTAYERSLAQDRERARLRREAEAAKRKAEEEAARAATAKETQERNMLQWKLWRSQSLQQEPGPDITEASRISIRMPDGSRVVRKFRANAGIEELYAFVECYDVLSSNAHDEQIPVEQPRGFDHTYRFRLVSPMPRVVYEIGDGGRVGERVGKSNNLIVEAISDEDDSEAG